ncbi:uncharacterized protein LOC144752744 [Lissotriton helveticus]
MYSAAVQDSGLEELLTFDDLFLEYFNAFLAQPAFPVRLCYDPLLGKVKELDGFLLEPASRRQEQRIRLSHFYGAGEVERERTLHWLKKERFPPFKRTVLYLEYKLAKLPVRSLQDRHPATRFDIRGYSRQADSAGVSSIPSTAGHPVATQGPGTTFPKLSDHLVIRLPSRTRSTPANLGGGACRVELYSLECNGELMLGYYTPWEVSAHMGLPSFSDLSHLARADPGGHEEGESRWKNAEKSGYSDVERNDLWEHGPAEGSHSKGDRGPFPEGNDPLFCPDEELEEVRDSGEFPPPYSLTRSTLQRMKEEVLGTLEGMEAFQSFLQGTQGVHLLHFWMDCEDFKERFLVLDVNEDHPEARHLCAHLFRCILDKHKRHLTAETQVQIRDAQENVGLTFRAFSRPQYDALRRLRSYWVPRFLIHRHRGGHLRGGLESRSWSKAQPGLKVDFLPPVLSARPGDGRTSWTKGRKDGGGVLPLGPKTQARCPDSGRSLQKTQLLEKLLAALSRDREAGSPFLHYLTRFESAQMVHNFLLWRELEDYWAAEAKQTNCQLLHRAAWDIHHKYLRPDAPCAAGLLPETALHFGDPEGIDSPSLGSSYTWSFEAAARHALEVLRIAWLRYLTYDISTFLECCVPAPDATPEEEEEGGGGRRKADRTAKRRGTVRFNIEGGRTPHKKKKQRRTTSPIQCPQRHLDSETPRGPPFELLQSTTVFNVYQKVVHDTEGAEPQEVLEMLHQLNQCRATKAGKRRLRLVRKFLAMDCAQRVWPLNPVPKTLTKQLEAEVTHGKISDECLEAMGGFLGSLLEESFGRFWKDIAEGLIACGVQPSQVGPGGWSRLEPLLHTLASKLILRRLKKRKAKLVHKVRAQPTPEDKDLLSRSLQLAAEGWPTLEMLHFLKYLQTYGPMEDLPLLENHLRFCLEVQKFKNAHHDVPDKALLKKKTWIIRDCFLASQVEPSLQIDMDEDLLQRTMMAVEDSLNVDLPEPGLFDELHAAVFTSLLPFWAGFRKMWVTRSAASAQRPPVLRVQHLLKRRLATFHREEEPEKTFHLPPLPPPGELQRSQKLPRFTYNFTVSKGLMLKDNDMEETEIDAEGAPGSRKMSEVCLLPPIPELTQA